MTHEVLAWASDGEEESGKLLVPPIQDYTLHPFTLTPLILLGIRKEVTQTSSITRSEEAKLKFGHSTEGYLDHAEGSLIDQCSEKETERSNSLLVLFYGQLSFLFINYSVLKIK